ncbi:DDE superfamily endonuclease [Popillia japonica]|uniref:DDE superfamily endonuclease n=1 Tax=Popillia japonica TaxID=7064 RepID=A0AAW1K0Z0_POPJA
MKPWGQKSTKEEKIFNYRLSRARRIVENAFGILTNRFQVLQKDINLEVSKVQDVALACCVLHNYIKHKDGKTYLKGIEFEACCVLHNYIKHKDGKTYLKGIEFEDTETITFTQGE